MALSGRPGPVFLELAWDVLCNGADEDGAAAARAATAPTRAAAGPAQGGRGHGAAQGRRAPGDHRRLLGVLGRRVGRAAALLRDGAGARVPQRRRAAAACRPGHPLFFQHTRKEALTGADVVFVIGTPFDFRLNYGAEPTFSAESKIVQVDIDPTEIGRNRAVEVGIIADSFSALERLRGRGAARPSATRYLSGLRAREEKKLQRPGGVDARSDSVPIHHYRLAKEMSDVANAAGQDPVFIADGGNWVAMAAKVHRAAASRAAGWTRGRWAAWAWARRSRIAAKMLHPERTHLGHPGRRLVRPQRHGLRDGAALQAAHGVRGGQRRGLGADPPPAGAACSARTSRPATLLAPTRYDKVVEAIGGHGEHVTEPAQIRPALERALASGTVACVNVMLDPDAPVKAGAMGYAV